MGRPAHPPWAGVLKYPGRTADGLVMFRSARSQVNDVGSELRRLDTSHSVFQLDNGWFVVGPTGLFVVTADEGDLHGASRWAADRAMAMRAWLADQLVWVPCVDPVVVTAQAHLAERIGALTVPLSLLHYTLAEGPRTVDDGTLSKLGLLALKRMI